MNETTKKSLKIVAAIFGAGVALGIMLSTVIFVILQLASR